MEAKVAIEALVDLVTKLSLKMRGVLVAVVAIEGSGAWVVRVVRVSIVAKEA